MWSLTPFNHKKGILLDYHARLAQSVEHQTFNLRVAGSSPSSGGMSFYWNIPFQITITRILYSKLYICSLFKENLTSAAANNFILTQKMLANDEKMYETTSWYAQRIDCSENSTMTFKLSATFTNQDGRVVKALDLSSNGRMSAWVRTPLLVRHNFC